MADMVARVLRECVTARTLTELRSITAMLPALWLPLRNISNEAYPANSKIKSATDDGMSR